MFDDWDRFAHVNAWLYELVELAARRHYEVERSVAEWIDLGGEG
jgi:hypothetical protein